MTPMKRMAEVTDLQGAVVYLASQASDFMTGSDIVVTFAILAKKATINKTPRFLETVATANHEYDYVKIGLDKDGDLFVRTDLSLRLLDSQEMKNVIDQVANASEEVFIKVAGSVRAETSGASPSASRASPGTSRTTPGASPTAPARSRATPGQ